MVIWYLNNRFKIVVFKISNTQNIIHTSFRGFVIIKSQNLPKGNFCIFKLFECLSIICSDHLYRRWCTIKKQFLLAIKVYPLQELVKKNKLKYIQVVNNGGKVSFDLCVSSMIM